MDKITHILNDSWLRTLPEGLEVRDLGEVARLGYKLKLLRYNLLLRNKPRSNALTRKINYLIGRRASNRRRVSGYENKLSSY